MQVLTRIAVVALALALLAPPVTAQIVLNEVLPAPGTDWTSNGEFSSSEDEWIEVMNTGAAPATVEGWFVTDATGTPRIGLSGSLDAGEHVFLTGEHASDWESLNGFPSVGLSLNNSGDTVRLFQVAGGTSTLADSLEYGSLGPNVSLGRLPDGTGSWQPFDALVPGGTGPQPTPGGANGGPASPKILSMEITPSFPTDVDPIAVRAVAADADGISSAALRLRLNGGPVASYPMSLWDGSDPYGTWERTLNPQPIGTLVSIVVRVSDGTLLEETNEVELVVLSSDVPVVLNEILADPAADAAGDANGDGTRSGSEDEFVEILNRGDVPVDVGGWRIEDLTAIRHEFPAGLVLAPGELYVVFGGGSPTGIPSRSDVASSGGLSLNNSGEEARLVGADDLARDVHSWGSEGNADQSLIRHPDGDGPWTRPSDLGLPWAFSPGVPNGTATSVDDESWAAVKALYRD